MRFSWGGVMAQSEGFLPEELEAVHHQAAEMLATKHTVKAVAEACQVGEATIYRWKRFERFRLLIKHYTPANQVELAISERQENFDLISEARDAELLLTAELRESLEKLIGIIKRRLDVMSESEIDQLALRHLSPLLKVFSDGIGILQSSHDRLTGYGQLMRQLEEIIEKNSR